MSLEARGWSGSKLTGAAAIEVHNLTCRRGGRAVFSGLSFRAEAGALTAVVGANGAGKTSLLRCMAGLIRPSAGTIRYSGSEEMPSLHWLGHAEGLKPALSLSETLAFSAALAGLAPDAIALAEAASRVGLGHALHLPTRVLSAGQRRRAGLARFLVDRRGLWLLDEPTAALDRAGEALLGALMAEHLATGGAILAATHAALPVAPTTTLELRPPERGAAHSGDSWA